MRAKSLSELLKAGDRVAVSNITGREASIVSVISQQYCSNIVGGWALGRGGQTLDVPGGKSIPVFANVEELANTLVKKDLPNKVVVYSPPPAVYGEVKEIIDHLGKTVETLFIVTEHVSIEVTAKIAQICSQANVDVLGCNSLGIINSHDAVRAGAVGGLNSSESFRPGSAAIISNSGNMVNTMASYMQSAGIGTSYGISTGKDTLILFAIKNLLELANSDEKTRIIVAYIEPGGLYEKEAVEVLSQMANPKPIIAYVTGEILEKSELALGHAGAVVEGEGTTASAKMKLFDDYFGIEAFEPEKVYQNVVNLKERLKRGIRIKTLHHLPAAAALIYNTLKIERDFRPAKPLKLSPWFVDYSSDKSLIKRIPRKLLLHRGVIPKPYFEQVKLLSKETLGASLSRRDMKKASHVSSNDGKTTRIYGYSLEKEMQKGSFMESLFLAWTGERVCGFEAELLERCLIAALTNGPGTISAQGAKLSTSAGNSPNTAMIATLACLGDVHGGNGRKAIEYLINIFRNVEIENPWKPDKKVDLQAIVNTEADRFSKVRSAAKEAGADYERIPCLGHPVFRNESINYDPRERVIAKYLEDKKLSNLFLEFYHKLAHRLKEIGIARNVWAVNVDGAIASVVLATCWQALKEKRLTNRRVCDIAFMLFAVGRTAGAGGEFLDHQDYGTPMDMRIPASEAVVLTRPKD